MNKKWIYFAVICLTLAVTFYGSVVSKESNKREHQHLTATTSQPCDDNDQAFCTHLPIVSINTNGASIPGMELEKQLVRSELKIYDTQGKNNHLTDKPALTTLADIRYRGNSSLHFDKKSYLVKLVHADGTENKQKVLGMPSHDNWVMNGPFLDKTLMRNYLGMNISAEIMGYAPRVRFFELFVNEQYQGVYVMMEMISQGKERVNISSYKDGDPFTSYILRVDRGDIPENELNNFTKYALRMPPNTETHRFMINVEYPPTRKLTPELKDYIERDFNKFEKSLYSYDYDDDDYGYESLIDTQSFVDFFIINEFFQNYDAIVYSTYFYKDIRGKIHIGPVWDFNNAFGNYMEVAHDGTGFQLHERTWYFMLTKEEAFVDAIVHRYKTLRETILSEEYLMNYIDETAAFLGDARDRNFEVWGYSFDPSKLTHRSLLVPYERNITSYDQAIAQLKGFIQKRGSWMDENIETLYQYSHESKNKKFNH